MALVKLDQKTFPFFKGATAAGSSDIFNNYGNYTSLSLEVSNATAISLKVQGCINVEGIEDANLSWTDLAVINNGDYSVSSNIAANGIYSVGISGLTKIRVVITSITGDVTVIGVMEV